MLFYFWIAGRASESCWPMWAWALVYWEITSCESLPDLLDWIICFGLSCNISLYHTLYFFPFHLRMTKHRIVMIPKNGYYQLSCRWLGLEFLQFQRFQLLPLVNCTLLSSFKLCFCVVLSENILVRNMLSLSLYHCKHWIQASLGWSLFPPFSCFGTHLTSHTHTHTHTFDSIVVAINQVSRFSLGIKFETFSAFVTTHLFFLS